MKKKSNLPNCQGITLPSNEVSETVSIINHFRQLQPVSKNKPEEIENRVDDFFKMCESYGIKPSVELLCVALGVTRQAVWLWEQDEKSEAGKIVSRAKSLINAMLTHFTMEGKINFAYSIWLQKNHYGYSDSKQIEVIAKQGTNTLSLEEQVKEADLVWNEETGEFEPGRNI